MPSSAAVRARLAALRFQGQLTEADAANHGCRLISTQHGADHAPDHIRLDVLVDQGGLATDARYRTNATEELLAAYDVMVELLVGRPLIEATAITPRRVEQVLRGTDTEPAFPLTLEADLPFIVLRKVAEAYERPKSAPASPDQLPWTEIGLFEKVRRIEAVLDQHVRPALASDGGGIDLVDLKGDELVVQYQGTCGSCSSSIGGTLNFITDSLNNHLGVTLTVTVSQVELEESPSFGL